MHFWLIQPAEAIPLDRGGHRLWRTGITAQLMQASGHQVTWWTSSYSHLLKSFRDPSINGAEVAPGYEIRLIPALGYTKNLSIRRIRDHRFVARCLRALMESAEKPDLILASYPTIDTCVEAVRFGEKHGVPVVIDVRDQWPDLFYDAFPKFVRPLAQSLGWRMSMQANEVFRKAAAISANAEQALNWALLRGQRQKTNLDRAFAMGYMKEDPAEGARAEAQASLVEKGVDLRSGRLMVVYGGAIGSTGDFETVIEAARLLESQGVDAQFVLAGVGDDVDRLSKMAQDIRSVVFTGWLRANEIVELLRSASVGLVPYRDRANFEGGVTNKPVEYMAWGLPIVTTLQRGILHNTLAEHGCGRFYRAGQPVELAEILAQLAKNTEERSAMSANALALFESDFKAEAVYQKMVDHLVEVAEAYREGRR